MYRAADDEPGTRTVDLLIRHAHVLTMDDVSTQFKDGAIAVVGRDIVEVGDDREMAGRVRARRTIDAGGAPVHPGLVDAHVHASFGLLRGVHPDHADEDAIFAGFYVPFLNAVSDAEEFLGTLLTGLEMVRHGTTTWLEAGTVLEPAAAAEAATTVGIRAVLGDPFIWDRPGELVQGHDGDSRGRVANAGAKVLRAPVDLETALASLGTELRRNAEPDALVTGHIAINGLGTASESLLIEAKRRADAAGVIMSMHHAYSAADIAVDRERFGADPLHHFAGIGVLGHNVTLAHANHLSDPDASALLECEASLVWAPAASMLWGHGGASHGRHAELWRRGLNISLGSDSANWSNDFDVFRQADLALLATREARGDRTALMAEEVLAMATRGGAMAAGMADRIGSLEPGKRADIVVHRLDRPGLVPTTDMVRNLMHSGRSGTVHTVIIDGRVIFEAGEFTMLDEPRWLARVGEASQALLRRLGHSVEADRVPSRG